MYTNLHPCIKCLYIPSRGLNTLRNRMGTIDNESEISDMISYAGTTDEVNTSRHDLGHLHPIHLHITTIVTIVAAKITVRK